MPFISASSCLTVCHGTHGESMSNTWRTRSQCVTEHRSMPYLLRAFYFHFLHFFLIQFRAQSAQPTVALSFQFVGHINGLDWSVQQLFFHSAVGSTLVMSWVRASGEGEPTNFHNRMNYIELFNEKYVCVVRFIWSFASTFPLWPEQMANDWDEFMAVLRACGVEKCECCRRQAHRKVKSLIRVGKLALDEKPKWS